MSEYSAYSQAEYSNRHLAKCQDGITAQGATIDVESFRFSYLEWGTGSRVIFLLHGITSSARTWWRVAPALVTHGYHVFALDMPGHGFSQKPEHGYAFETSARLVDALIARLGVTRPVIIGHSWGGIVALVLAASNWRSTRPLSLVLLDPPLQIDSDQARDWVGFFSQGIGTPFSPESVAGYLAKNPRWTLCDAFWKAEAMELCSPTAVDGFFLENAPWDLAPRIVRLDIPLLLIRADAAYSMITDALIAELTLATRSNPLTRIATIPESSHNLHRDSYSQLLATLFPFLQQTASSD